jgi:hypothetical protein
MRRRCIGDPVMIEHDDVHAEPLRAFHGRVVLAATVDSNQEACS